jgi:hypothetical protein
MQEELKARLHPHWVGGEAGYVYSVICEGKLLVERSRDPECDAARALVVQGIIGRLSLCDGKTGKPRTIIDIERAAKLTVEAAAGAESTAREVAAKATAPKKRWLEGRQHEDRFGPNSASAIRAAADDPSWSYTRIRLIF